MDHLERSAEFEALKGAFEALKREHEALEKRPRDIEAHTRHRDHLRAYIEALHTWRRQVTVERHK